MLAYISMFLLVLLVVATAVCAYRLLYRRQGFTHVRTDFPAISNGIGRKLRQGLLFLKSALPEPARQVNLHGPKGGIKTPWGW